MIQPQNLKILIAEDEADLREILVSRFKVFGFQVFEADGGDAAFELFQSQPLIDTVVTDIRMPRGTGIELLKKLKQLNPLNPKVFLVSAADGLSHRELYALGAEGFLEKPYDMRVLIEMVRKSMLSNKERWRMPPNFGSEAKIDLSFSSLSEAEKSKSFGLGRGGFFVKTNSPLPPLGQHAIINIKANPLEISTVGKLKWTEKADGNSFYAGFEFVHLNGPGAEAVYQLIENNSPISFIPAP